VETNRLICGDSREVLKELPDESIDSVVTDPPAGIAFMAKEWDTPDVSNYHVYEGKLGLAAPLIGSHKGNIEEHSKARLAFVADMMGVFSECFRVLKPGGYMIVWSIPRTSHWTATALENVGFEIRDCIYHVFGQGFPKNLDVSKAIDKMAGAERPVVKEGRGFDPEKHTAGQFSSVNPSQKGYNTPTFIARIGEVTEPATKEAKKWEGWGTALKPAVETWWLVRKPIDESSVAAQVVKTGTGGINIDGCRVEGLAAQPSSIRAVRRFDDQGDQPDLIPSPEPNPLGRWPSHLMLTHSPECQKIEGAEQTSYECAPGCPVAALDDQSGITTSSDDPTRFGGVPKFKDTYAGGKEVAITNENATAYGDTGGASRFFKTFEPTYKVPFYYTGKASRSDKDADLHDFPDRPSYMVENGSHRTTTVKNHHPTVKSQALMRYLVRLVTPKGGIVLDPFSGSGSTLVAAISEGMHYIGVEREQEYFEIAQARTERALKRAKEEAAQRDAFDLMFEMPQE
jgi:site-specific DNA-methyltransferase (adenine-specific)